MKAKRNWEEKINNKAKKGTKSILDFGITDRQGNLMEYINNARRIITIQHEIGIKDPTVTILIHK